MILEAKRIWLISLLPIILFALLYGQIPQAQDYHNFADGREFLGIPNTLDVMSNLAILYPGIVGLLMCLDPTKRSQISDDEYSIHITLFSGMVLTFAGSVWYHLEPNDASLLWDRLGMSIVIGSVVSLLIHDMYDSQLAGRIHLPIVILSVISVLTWPLFDDLRIYFIVKHQPFLILIILYFIGRKTYDKIEGFAWALGMFGIATAFEFTDLYMFELTGIISGHSMKHILAGLGLWYLYAMIRDRELLAFEEE